VRIVLDSNTVFSGILWKGPPHQLLLALRQREDISLFTSPKLLGELFEILARPKNAKYLAKVNTSPSQVLADYMAIVNIVEPKVVPRVIANDPDDDHVIAAAITAQASIIVSGDKHLLNLKNYQGIAILNARQACQIINQI
jgi:uncharacterized protein